MTKTYLFNYNEGDYFLINNQPEKEDMKFSINEQTMEFNTTNFYEFVFKDVDENITIQILNKLDEDQLEKNIYKKGLRIYQTIGDLCKEICDGINEECFAVNTQ